MGQIRVLPNVLVNQIAAGEVVERPASVVKELVENAIDARATRVAVAIEEGGRQLIRVVDDGEGIAGDELELAVAPHATSKISREEDLFGIATMGFRGEALASIGAVSRLRIRSRRHDSQEGHEILVVGERIERSRAAGCPPGTTVEVRDLFFNVPARRKFLRGVSTEAGHVSEQFARLALPQPRIAFELTHNQRTSHRLAAQSSIKDRVARFYGPELADELIPIDWNERGLRIEGYVAPPARSRATGQWQYVFVNDRYVRDRFVQHALKEAYRGLMEPNRHPVVFLFLSIDPALLDVNVHPTKIEVRWQDSNLIHSQVLAALREKFLRTDLTPALRGPAPGRSLPGERATDADQLRRQAAEFFRTATPAMESQRSRGTSPAIPSARPTRGTLAESEEFWRSLPPPAAQPVAEPKESGPLTEPRVAARGRAIQVHNTYLVVETPEGMLVIDQHALHERILYHQLSRRIAGQALEAQRLLLPETIAVTPAQVAVLETHADLLQRLGLEMTPFGRDSVAVQAVPTVLRDTDVADFARDVLDKLSVRGSEPHTEALIQDLLSMMACKAAVKAGDPLTPQEIEALIAQRHDVEKSTSCPHGRPTALRFTLADLEKQFKRT
jgi:DNA mismatch repair protein MutL